MSTINAYANFHLRLADENDMPAILHLRLQLLSEMGNLEARNPEGGDIEISNEDLREVTAIYVRKALFDGRVLIWLAFDGVDAVACGAANIYERLPYRGNLSGQEWYISNMYTQTAHRRRGIAKAMVKAIQQEARERCVERVWLEASSDGAAVYQQSGFTPLQNAMVWRP